MSIVQQIKNLFFLAVKSAESNTDMGLVFRVLDNQTAMLGCYADASFASNGYLSSQLGFGILLYDNRGQSHFLDFQSRKSSRFVQCSLAAKVFRLCDASLPLI